MSTPNRKKSRDDSSKAFNDSGRGVDGTSIDGASSHAIGIEEIIEMREKAIEREKTMNAERVVARTRPSDAAMPGGRDGTVSNRNGNGNGNGNEHVDGETEPTSPDQYQATMTNFWQHQFNQDNASVNDEESQRDDLKEKKRVNSKVMVPGRVDHREVPAGYKTNSSSHVEGSQSSNPSTKQKKDQPGKGKGNGMDGTSRTSRPKADSINKLKMTTAAGPCEDDNDLRQVQQAYDDIYKKPSSGKKKSVKTDPKGAEDKEQDKIKKSLEAGANPPASDNTPTPDGLVRQPHHAMPGAFAHSGPGASGDDSEMDNLEAGEAHVSPAAPSMELGPQHMVDAKTVENPTNVTKDRFRRNTAIAILAILVIGVVAAIVLWRVLGKTSYQGPDACKPLTVPRSVPARCYCYGSTNDFFDELQDQENATRFYDEQVAFLIEQNVMNSSQVFDKDSCDPLNQYLLIATNISLSSAAEGTELFGISSDESRLSIFALIYMYITMGGEGYFGWLNKDDWLSREVCSYFGVDCVFIETFHKLLLPENGLNGTLPSYVGLLRSLRYIDLSDNEAIGGPIPTEFGHVSLLQSVQLKDSGFTGTIPSEFSNLDKLFEIDLSENELTGRIPKEIFSLGQLRILKVAENRLQGSIPPEIADSTGLIEIDLGGNELRGPIPTEIGLLTDLELLELNNNTFQGTIPDFLGTLPHLESINLFNSGLTGTIPETFCNFTGTVKRTLILNCKDINPRESCSCCSFGGEKPSKLKIECDIST